MKENSRKKYQKKVSDRLIDCEQLHIQTSFVCLSFANMCMHEYYNMSNSRAPLTDFQFAEPFVCAVVS